MSRWDDLTPRARQFLEDFDELDIAAIAAGQAAELKELHEGEAETDDDLNVTSAPLWLRRFNRATPQQRLAMAELIINAWPELDNCRFNHGRLSEDMQWHRAREARYRLAWKSARRRAATAEAALTTLCASAAEGLLGLGEPPRQPHECRIWEADGEWNVSCTACAESRFDMGSEHDCEVWVDNHAVEAQP